MSGSVHSLSLFLLLLVVSLPKQVTQLQPNHIVEVDLEAQQFKYFQITITQPVDQDINMYFIAQSPFNDPYEQPYVSISSTQNYQQNCFSLDDEFAGICSIPNSQLNPGRKFQIQLYCLVDCKLKVSAYYDNVAQIRFGTSLQLYATEQFGYAQGIKIKVPDNLQFTELFVMLQIQNSQEIFEGVEMYANWGSNNVTMPSTENHMRKGQTSWQFGMGIFLSNEEIKAGDQIKLEIVLGQKVKAKIFSGSQHNNVQTIYLYQNKFDFTTKNQQKIYVLQLGDIDPQFIDNYDVLINICIYSGLPYIQVSFDGQFPQDKILQNSYIEATLNYVLSPSVRQEKGFKDNIYIKVKSYESSTFSILGRIPKNLFLHVMTGITNLIQVQQNQVQNLILEDINLDNGKDQQIISYKVTAEVISGNMEIGVRMCESIQKNHNLECLISQKETIFTLQRQNNFSSIEVTSSVYENTLEIFWSYDVKQCRKFEKKGFGGIEVWYSCQFQIVVLSSDEFNSTYAAITVDKRTISKELKEGIIVRNYIPREEYHYYSFTLHQTQSIKEIDFFVTVIDGDVRIILSRNKKYPDLHDVEERRVKTSINDNIIIKDDQITKGTYYIAIYANEVAQYTISVAIEREAQNTTKITQIQLKTGIAQTYTMDKSRQFMYFTFSTPKVQETTIQVITLKGKITFQVFKLEGDKEIHIPCVGEVCSFTSEQEASYLVEVKGNMESVQKFSITLKQEDTCLKHPINFPFYVVIRNETVCYEFNVAKESLQITIGLTTLEMLRTSLHVMAQFPKETLQIKESQKILRKEILQLLCEGQKNQFSSQLCKFRLKFSSERVLGFLGTVQRSNSTTTLFDGIVHSVTTDSLSPTTPKNYIYYIFEQNQVLDLFLTTKTSSSFKVLVKIIAQEDLSSMDRLFPTFNQSGYNVFTYYSVPGQPILAIRIHPTIIIQSINCSLCIALISVYGIKYDQSYIYTLEVAQGSRTLELGQTKIGLLGDGQVNQYQLQPNSKPSLITIDTSESENCLRSYVKYRSKFMTQFHKIQQLASQNETVYVIVESKAQICRYQVSYVSTEFPVIALLEGISSTIQLNNSQHKFYLFHNNQNQSFRVIEVVETGDALIGVSPVSLIEIENLLNMTIDQFQFQLNNTLNDLLIPSTSQHFCVECYYLIQVQGYPSVLADVVVVRGSTPIPLKDGSTLKDSVLTGQKRYYSFSVLNAFNLTVNMVFGAVRVQIMDSSNTSILIQTLKIAQTLSIPQPANRTNNYMGVSYIISIEGNTQSSFSVTPHIKQKIDKLSEGEPKVLYLSENGEQRLQFKNVKETGKITILIDDATYTNASSASLTFTLTLNGQTQIQPTILKSAGSYNLQVEAKKGTYVLTINTDEFCLLSILYVKQSLTQLLPGKTNILKKQGKFQIYSSGDSVMIEIYNCEGEVEVKASSYYEYLEKEDNQYNVIMEHSNYGGHYVLTTNNLQGSYFMETIDKREEGDLTYLISYNNYRGDQMPYKFYSIPSSEIFYKESQQSVQFLMNPVSIKDGFLPFTQITYFLYISKYEEQLTDYMKCSLGSVYQTQWTTQKEEGEPISFNFQKQKIQQILGKDTSSYLVGGQVVIRLKEQDQKYTKQLNLIYDKTYISVSQEPPLDDWFADFKYILMFIVLPCLIGSILLILAGRYCYRNFRAYPTQMIEEDDEMHGPSMEELKERNQKREEKTE